MRHSFYVLDPLSKRELQVLQLMAEGLTGKQIAKELYVNHKTIEAHRSKIILKLGAKNGINAIYNASKLGLV